MFKLKTDFSPSGDQPQAIEELTSGIKKGESHQVLLGVTGSGKTFTMANVIANVNMPTLVISHNKTLAAQLYSEFKTFFPENAVEYFVSYYDYYQPEAYIPQTDTYIEKDASINEHIDRLRLKATSSILERNDVIIVASVSCIYNLGSPKDYREMVLSLSKKHHPSLKEILRRLVKMQYERNDYEFTRGRFRLKGDVLEIYPAYLEMAYRIDFFGDDIESIKEIEPLTGKTIRALERIDVYPAKHFLIPEPQLMDACVSIKNELDQRLKELKSQNKLVEAQRLETRTLFDLEMLRELGYCPGIENYSRHLNGRLPGERPFCLIDYFPERFLTIIDESHVTIPQLNGMYNGDYSRKKTLVEYGFRLPSALDNRPLRFEELEGLLDYVLYVSATPGPYELRKTKGVVTEQLIRPTGLVDPEVIIKPTKGELEDLINEIKKRIEKRQRTLVTTLTKRLAEDLCNYLIKKGLKVRYLHSDIETLDRIQILYDLRKGNFDVLVGINLLREGLDLPEVSLVAILDADKEGFLRSETSLIQVCGRAARNVDGKVIMYADNITGSMQKALKEMNRRRQKQLSYNEKYHIVPKTIQKAIQEREELVIQTKQRVYSFIKEKGYDYIVDSKKNSLPILIRQIEKEMKDAANNLDFELAAILRDKLFELKGKEYKKKNRIENR